jgi:4-hydroxyphenylpyruvate dioxygenase
VPNVWRLATLKTQNELIGMCNYDDLAARTELDPELIAAMRELGVLYDRDTHGEVVERRGGYDGYGAANSPVRMAAQREPSRS